MPLHPLYGHEALRRRLGAAVRAGRLPQALLLEGPHGVGKQRVALWLAQALLCERPTPAGEPCGSCQPCRFVLALSHPDLHWFVPVEVSRRGRDAEKQIDVVEAALGEELAARREQPLYAPPSGLAAHGIASAHLLARRLQLTPRVGRWKVFIVGDAERLVPQAANPEAANALLKALEEPPANATLILTSAEPQALLPTIVSRIVRVRVGRVHDSVVTDFGQVELGLKPGPELAKRVRAAGGAIGKLLASNGAGAGAAGGAEAFLAAARAGATGQWALALAQQPFQARGGFTALLDQLLERLRDEARAGRDTDAVLRGMASVLNARELAQGNVNPQLLTAVLAEELGTTR
jgi:DNA polymerase III subunit delta'